MQIEKPDILFKECVIKPLDDMEGLITAIRFDECRTKIQVRYFLGGLPHFVWFFDTDIELKIERIKVKEAGFT